MKNKLSVIYIAVVIFLGLGLYTSIERSKSPDVADSASSEFSKDDLEIGQQQAGKVFGLVKTLSGLALESGKVCVMGNNLVNQYFKSCVDIVTDGHYTVDVPEGSYQVVATVEKHRGDNRLVTIANNRAEEVNFNLAVAEPTIAGRVLSAEGFALAGAEVTLFKDQKRLANLATDAEGRFAGWIPSGPAQVVAVMPGYSSGRVLAVAPALDLNVRLFPGYSVSGAVIEEATGSPIAGVKVVAATSLVNTSLIDTTAVSDNEGRFILNGLSEGEFYISVFDDEWTSLPVQQLFLDDNNTHENIRILAQAGVSITGFLMTDNGPCQNGRALLVDLATVNNSTPIAVGSIVSDEGMVTFPAIPASRYRARVECSEHTLIDGPRSIDVDQASSLPGSEWRFSAGDGFEVSVVDGTGSPIMEARLELTKLNHTPDVDQSYDEQGIKESQTFRQVIADSNGGYQFGALSPGQYQVQARVPGVSTVEPVTKLIDIVPGGDELLIEIVIPVSGSIEILAQSESKESVTRIFIYALNQQSERFEAVHVGNGLYKIFPLPAGSYQVFAYDNVNPKKPLFIQGEEWVLVEDKEVVSLRYEYETPNGAIRGAVVDHSGNPVIGASVRVASDSISANESQYSYIQEVYQGKQHSLTDKAGQFKVVGLDPSSSFSVLIQSPNGLPFQRHSVSPGENLSFVLQEPAKLNGNLKASGRFVIEIYSQDMEAKPVTEYIETRDGKFFIEQPLLPGPAHISVINENGDKRANIDLDLFPGPNTVEVGLQSFGDLDSK